MSFKFNKLVITTVGGQTSRTFTVNQPFVVVITFTVRNLSPHRTVEARIVRVRKRHVPGKGLQLVLTSSVSIAAHSGRNVYTYTSNAERAGSFRIAVSISIKGKIRTLHYDLRVS